MAKIGEIYGTGKYLKANPNATLGIEGEPEEVTLMVGSITVDEFKDKTGESSQKFTLHWTDKSVKPLGLNKTNCNTIAKMIGSDESDDWIGASITLFVVPEEMSDSGFAVRVRKARKAGAPATNGTAPAAATGPVLGGKNADALRAALNAKGLDVERLRKFLTSSTFTVIGPVENWPAAVAPKAREFLANPDEAEKALPIQETDIPF